MKTGINKCADALVNSRNVIPVGVDALTVSQDVARGTGMAFGICHKTSSSFSSGLMDVELFPMILV
jgi:hypothetical protein